MEGKGENKVKERGGITFCFPFSLLLSKEALPDFFLLTSEIEINSALHLSVDDG